MTKVKQDSAAGIKRKLSRCTSEHEALTANARKLRELIGGHQARIAELEGTLKKAEREVADLTTVRDETAALAKRMADSLKETSLSRDRWRESYRELRAAFGREGTLDSLDRGSVAE